MDLLEDPGGIARGATGGVGGADDTFPSEPTTPAPGRGHSQGQVSTYGAADQGNDGGDGFQSGSNWWHILWRWRWWCRW